MRSLENVPFLTTVNASPYRARSSRPSAPSKEASRLLLNVASTPPMSGGEWRAQSFTSWLQKKRALIERPFKGWTQVFLQPATSSSFFFQRLTNLLQILNETFRFEPARYFVRRPQQ